MKRSFLLAVVLVAGLISSGAAEISDVLNYQGVLTDAGGAAVPDGSYEITFRFYNVVSGGSHLWQETQPAVQVTKGIFNVMLGSVMKIDLPFDARYYLGISVEGEAELTPRIALSAAAYAFTSMGTLGDDNVFPSSGNVGIGTTTPGYPLVINADTQVGLEYNGNNSGYASIYVNAVQPTARPTIGYMRGTLRAMTLFDVDDHFKIRIDGTDHLSLSGAGNFGVGVMAPAERLDLAGGLRLGMTGNTNAGTIRWTGADFEGYTGSSWESLTDAGSGSLPAGMFGQTLRHDGAEWHNSSNLYNDGLRIGIGTTSPEEDLHVMGTGTQQIRVETASTNGKSDLRLLTTGGTSDYLMVTKHSPSAVGTTLGGSLPVANLSEITTGSTAGPLLFDVLNSNPMIFGTNNFERMRLDEYGNIGIRTTTPDANLHIGGSVKIGTDTYSGDLDIYRAGVANSMIAMGTSSGGGEIYMHDEGGVITSALIDDGNGTGGYFYVRRDPTYTAFRVDGNYNGTGSPIISMFGGSATAAFNMGTVGNDAVQLPASSISNTEILNEAGATSYAEGTVGVALTGGSAIDIIATRSITTPASGYVLVLATCQPEPYHTSGTYTSCDFGVSNTASFPANQDCRFRLNSLLPTGYYNIPVTCHGLFEVGTGATHTFNLLGRMSTGDINVYDIQMTLVYLPTAYGTVDPTLAGGAGTDADDAVRPALTASDVAAERAASEAANLARIERELAELRAQIEALNLSDTEEK